MFLTPQKERGSPRLNPQVCVLLCHRSFRFPNSIFFFDDLFWIDLDFVQEPPQNDMKRTSYDIYHRQGPQILQRPSIKPKVSLIPRVFGNIVLSRTTNAHSLRIPSVPLALSSSSRIDPLALYSSTHCLLGPHSNSQCGNACVKGMCAWKAMCA